MAKLSNKYEDLYYFDGFIVRPKKGSLFSENQLGEKIFITLLLA